MLKKLAQSFTTGRVARITRRADRLRDRGNPIDAAKLYKKSAQLALKRPDLYVQLGNMLKDSGRYGEAVKAYENAFNGFVCLFDGYNSAWLDEQLADVCLQLGHAFKLAGARSYAVHFYRRSNDLKPMPDFANELSITLLTEHGISEHPHDLPMPNLVEWSGGTSAIVDGGIPFADGHRIIKEAPKDFECICWSREGIVLLEFQQSNTIKIMCRFCGSIM